MGIKYLWDTNSAIYYLQQQFPASAEKFIDDLLKDKNKISCELLHNILSNIYNKCEYNTYKYKYFELTFNKKFIDTMKTHIKIKNI